MTLNRLRPVRVVSAAVTGPGARASGYYPLSLRPRALAELAAAGERIASDLGAGADDDDRALARSRGPGGPGGVASEAAADVEAGIRRGALWARIEALMRNRAFVLDPAAQSAAAQVFKVFGGLTGQRPAGMPAADKMDKAALGDPLVVKMVWLNELQNYQFAPASDAAALLHDLQTVIYPIHVAGKPNGEMVMRKVDGAWSVRSFAGPAHVQAVESICAQLAKAGVPAGSMMLVRVPAMGIELVAYRDATGMKLTPVTDFAAGGLTAGQTLSASRVFAQLSPLAVQQQPGLVD